MVGAGGLGLNAIAVLRALKHQNIMVGRHQRREARGGAEGRRAQGGGRQRRGRRRKRIIEAAGGPVLAVIDLVNGTQTARFAFDALRKGGKLIQVGLFGGELTLPLPIMAIRALTVQGSYVGNPKELRELVKLAQDGDAAGAAGRDRAAEPGQRRADAAARRQGHRPAGAAVRGGLSQAVRLAAGSCSPLAVASERAMARSMRLFVVGLRLGAAVEPECGCGRAAGSGCR